LTFADFDCIKLLDRNVFRLTDDYATNTCIFQNGPQCYVRHIFYTCLVIIDILIGLYT